MAQENRTLEIIARVKDEITRNMKRMASSVKRIIKAGFLAPFKLLGKSLKGMKNALLGFAGALAAVFLIWRGGTWAAGVIDAADSINKLAQATGATVESLSELEVAFEFAGLDASKFRVIMTGLGRATNQAFKNVGSAQFAAFEKLGVTAELLKSGNVTGVFEQMARGLQKFNTETEKGEVLYDIFPDNFLVILPLLGDLEKGFLANVNAARAFGAGLSEGLANIATETKDDLLKLNIALKNIAREGILGVAKELAPVLKGMAEFLRINKEGLSEALSSALKLLAEIVFALTKAIIWLSANLPQVRQSLIDLFDIAIVPESVLDSLKKFIGSDGLDGVRIEMQKVAMESLVLGEALKSAMGETAITMAKKFRKEMGRAPDDTELQKWLEANEDAARELRQKLKEAREELEKLNEQFQGFDAKQLGMRGADTKEIDAAIDRARILIQLAQLPGGLKGFGALAAKIPGKAEGEDKGKDRPIEEVESAFVQFFGTFDDGMKKALKNWSDFKKAGEKAGAALVDSLGNNLVAALASIIDGTKNAKEAFKEMANAIIADIAKIIARLIAMQAVQAAGTALSNLFATGGQTKGVVQSTVQLRSFARGGVVDRPTLALFGEGGGEAFVPLASGKIPVRIENAPSRVPEMNITIHAMDGTDVRRVLTRERDWLRTLQLNAMVSHRQTRETIKGASR